MTGMIYFNCISTLPGHIWGSFRWYFREGSGVVWCHLNKTESWNMIFLVSLRDKKRFVLKTFSHLKSINLFYLGTSSKDEITELHRWTETSQIPKKHESGYFHGWGWNGTPSIASCPVPPLQGHNFSLTLGASLAGGVSALALVTTQETWCKRQWGWFGGVFLDTKMFHTYMWQATKNCLVCYQKLDGVCQADPSGLLSEIPK